MKIIHLSGAGIFFGAFLSVQAQVLPVAPPIVATPLQDTRENEVIFQSPETRAQEQQMMQDRARRKPNARGLRYRPLQNDVRVDPFNDDYQKWLKSVRGDDTETQNPIDHDYEAFIRDISALLFSLGTKELPAESKQLLSKIPADAFKAIERAMEPKAPVTIARGDVKDPFPSEEEVKKAPKYIGPDVNLNIGVKKKDGHIQELLEMGYEALMTGQLESAIDIYKNALVRDEKNTQARFGLATSFHRAGRLDDARAEYIKLLKQDKTNWPAMNNFMLLSGEEAPEDALKTLAELEQMNPEFSPIPAQIGMIYLQQNKSEEAIKYFTRAVILSPENLNYRYNLAIIMDHAGYKTQASRLYQQLLNAGEQGMELPEPKEKIRERMTYIMSSAAAR